MITSSSHQPWPLDVEIDDLKGESIAVSDEKGKVKIVSAQEIPKLKKRLNRE